MKYKRPKVYPSRWTRLTVMLEPTARLLADLASAETRQTGTHLMNEDYLNHQTMFFAADRENRRERHCAIRSYRLKETRP